MSTSTQSISRKSGAFPTYGWVALIVVALAGVAAWIFQLSSGMQVTGLDQQVVWGLYIAAFFSTAAVGAGLLALVGVIEFAPFLSLAKRGRLLAIALASFIITALLVLVDIGYPIRAWRIITAFRFNAPMTWDFWALFIAGVITLVYLLLLRKSDQPQKLLGALGILAALALVLIEGVMLAELSARTLWGGLTIFAFIVAALVAGAAIALWLFGRGNRIARWLGAALLASLLIVLAEVIAGLTTDSPRALAETKNLLAGAPAPYFWFHVILGMILPIVLLLAGPRKALAGWIAALALLGVLAEKIWMLAAGQAQPWLALPRSDYSPSWVELLVVVGMFALGWLIFQLVDQFILPKKA